MALYSRAFAAATGDTPPEARTLLSAPFMSLLARNLIRRGEDVHQIMLDGGELRLQPIGSWDVRGGPRELDWWYRVDRFGPSGNLTDFVPAAAVLHVRYAIDSARPWYGISPLGWARSTGRLAANLETRLGEEAGGADRTPDPDPAGRRRGRQRGSAGGVKDRHCGDPRPSLAGRDHGGGVGARARPRPR